MQHAATMSSAPALGSRRGLNLALWIAQGLLFAGFAMAGAMKLTTPVDQLAAQMPWVTGAMGSLVRFIGAAEVLGAFGVVLPAATRIMPRLTTWAALGLTTVMALAIATHVARGEFSSVIANLVLGGLAAFVAWGRTARAPIASRR